MNAPPKLDGSDAAVPAPEPGTAPDQARVLRRLFRTLFLRGRSSRGLQPKGVPKSVAAKLALTVVFYALFGLIAMMFAGRPVFPLALYMHAMTLMFIGMFVASSAGEVLFNREESDILLHRPVTPGVLLWAKISVLVEVSLWVAGALNLTAFAVGVAAPDGGWRFLPVHALSVGMEALFCSGSVVLVYQLCLRWLGRERLDGLMTTAQVLMAVAAVAGGQLVPQLVIRHGGRFTITSDRWWLGLLPPAWFAGVDDALAGRGGAHAWMLSALAVAATGIVLWLAFGRLARQYQTGLMSLNESPTRPESTSGRRWLAGLVASPPLSWWLRNPVERAAFFVSAAYLLRDRDVKLRVYPALAPMIIMPVIFLMQGRDGGTGAFGVAFSGGYLGMLPLMSLELLEYSQQWQAADVFRSAPVAGPGPFCHGARRAVLLLLTVPGILLAVTLTLALTRTPSNLVLLLPGILALPVYAMIPCLRGKAVPLSRPTEESKSAGRAVRSIGVMILAMALSGVSIWAWNTGWFGRLMFAEAVAVAVTYAILRRSVSRTRWSSME